MFQDQNVTYLVNGKLCYVELEKLLRVKHYCCRSPKLQQFSEVDAVYRDDIRNNVYKSRRIVNERFNVRPDSSHDLLLCYQNFADGPDKSELYRYVSTTTDADIHRYNHQENHVLPIIAANKLNECLCVSIDGQGDGNLAVFAFANNELTPLRRDNGFSFGELYESFAAHFVSNGVYTQGVEGKFMAYAGLGKYVDTNNSLQRLFRHAVTGFNWNAEKKAANAYVATELEMLTSSYSKFDIANSIQTMWIDEVLSIINQFKCTSRRLVFSGGCALNCLLNRELVRTGWFDSIYWSPVASDTGQSLGAACNHLLSNEGTLPVVDWGKLTRGVDDAPEVISDVYGRMVELDVEQIVDVLVDDGLVGVVRGDVEPGPRALGNRSILASPLARSTSTKLNLIKGREYYRPYGIVVPRERMTSVVDIDVDAPFMNITADAAADIPAATHVDGSTRIQTITQCDNTWLHNLVTAFGDRTGVYALINTSFNDSGLPTFNYIADAERMYIEKLDALVFDDRMAVKR